MRFHYHWIAYGNILVRIKKHTLAHEYHIWFGVFGFRPSNCSIFFWRICHNKKRFNHIISYFVVCNGSSCCCCLTSWCINLSHSLHMPKNRQNRQFSYIRYLLNSSALIASACLSFAFYLLEEKSVNFENREKRKCNCSFIFSTTFTTKIVSLFVFLCVCVSFIPIRNNNHLVEFDLHKFTRIVINVIVINVINVS